MARIYIIAVIDKSCKRKIKKFFQSGKSPADHLDLAHQPPADHSRSASQPPTHHHPLTKVWNQVCNSKRKGTALPCKTRKRRPRGGAEGSAPNRTEANKQARRRHIKEEIRRNRPHRNAHRRRKSSQSSESMGGGMERRCRTRLPSWMVKERLRGRQESDRTRNKRLCVGEGSAIGGSPPKTAVSNCKPGACLRLLLSVYGRKAERAACPAVRACFARSVGASAALLAFYLYFAISR